jgi:arginine repressor
MRLKALIVEKFGTAEEFCKHIKDTGFVFHYSKLSRFINEYVDMNETERKIMAQALGVGESKEEMGKLFEPQKK